MGEVREEWQRLRAALEEEATLSRQSEVVIDGLKRRYVRLSPPDQFAVNALLGEWLLASDSSRRHDARTLVRTFAIASALPQLCELEQRLMRDSAIHAKHELASVRQVIATLTAAADESS